MEIISDDLMVEGYNINTETDLNVDYDISSLNDLKKENTNDDLEINKLTSNFIVNINKDLKSFRNKEKKFHNFIKSKRDNSLEIEKLKTIFDLTKKSVCNPDEIPFILMDNSYLTLNERVKNILKSSGLSVDFRHIKKTTYVQTGRKELTNNYNRGEIVRVFYRDLPGFSGIEIVLIDLYHLLATRNNRCIIHNFNKTKNYSCCMRTLLK